LLNSFSLGNTLKRELLTIQSTKIVGCNRQKMLIEKIKFILLYISIQVKDLGYIFSSQRLGLHLKFLFLLIDSKDFGTLIV